MAGTKVVTNLVECILVECTLSYGIYHHDHQGQILFLLSFTLLWISYDCSNKKCIKQAVILRSAVFNSSAFYTGIEKNQAFVLSMCRHLCEEYDSVFTHRNQRIITYS